MPCTPDDFQPVELFGMGGDGSNEDDGYTPGVKPNYVPVRVNAYALLLTCFPLKANIVSRAPRHCSYSGSATLRSRGCRALRTTPSL